MIRLDEKSIKDKIKEAKRLVNNEDEPFKTAAFSIIFSKLLDMGVVSSKAKAELGADHASLGDNVPANQLEGINFGELSYLRKLDYETDQILAILAHVFKSNVKLHLTVNQIGGILNDRFRIKIKSNQISALLHKATPSHVTREPINKKLKKKSFQYQINLEGLEHIDTKIKKLKGVVK